MMLRMKFVGVIFSSSAGMELFLLVNKLAGYSNAEMRFLLGFYLMSRRVEDEITLLQCDSQ
jgi:hypothetical protein